jgi:hypothetical protein
VGRSKGRRGDNFLAGNGVDKKEDIKMWLAKFWTPDTIFVTVVGGVMAVVLSASLFTRPQVSVKGSALVPPAALETIRNEQKDCNTNIADEQEMISRSLRTRC